MRVVALGSGGGFPSSSRQTSCYIIPELGICFDVGSGLYRIDDYRKTEKIHVLLSHPHLDHIQGLFAISHDSLKNYYIYATKEVIDAVKRTFQLPVSMELSANFVEIVPNNDYCIKLEDGRTVKFTSFPLLHAVKCYGFRVSVDEHSIAYVTDTTIQSADLYADKIEGVNLLLNECFCGVGQREKAFSSFHCTPEMVVDVCSKAKIENLVITHNNPVKNDDQIVEYIRKFVPNTRRAEDLDEFVF